MPQMDLESLVCGGGGCGGPKVACESTLIKPPYPNPHQSDPDPDLPAESFSIQISDDIDWLDINAVYDRDDSTKGTTNPKSHHHQHPSKPPNVNSQRFSGNLKVTTKAPIIALPNKIQRSGYLGQSTRRPQGLIFLKKGVKVSEPGSPKVSCFGKVLSQRERNRRKLPEVVEAGGGGFWANLAAVFRCFGHGPAAESAETTDKSEKNVPARRRKFPAAAMEAHQAEPPGLGGMKRFVSGRRPASWGGDGEADLEMEEGHVEWSGPLDRR